MYTYGNQYENTPGQLPPPPKYNPGGPPPNQPTAPPPANPPGPPQPNGGNVEPFPGYGDPAAFQKWYMAQQGGGRPEDMQRYLQPETLQRWDPYLIKNGPNAGKYRSMRGAPGFFDKPTECPPGQAPSGPNETDPCKPGGGAGGPGGPGGPGGAGGAGFTGGDFQTLQAELQARLKQGLAGTESRYNPDTVAAILAALKQRSNAQGQAGANAAREAFAARGMLQSGASAAAEVAARREGEQQFTQGYADLLSKKAEADYQDKKAALDSAMTYLQQLRQYALSQQMNALQRDQLNAQIELAYANIQSQFDLLQTRAGYAGLGL